MTAPSRSRVTLALGISAALLVAGCYSKIPVEDGGTMTSAEAQPPAEAKAPAPTMTPLEQEQARALADQKKRVAALADAKVEEQPLASAEPQTASPKPTPTKPEPRKAATAEHEQATSASAVAPGAGGWWVQIGSAREEKDGETLWSHSKAAHPDILGDASHAVVRADLGPGKGVFYRVHVGPYENANAAGSVCGRLRAAHVDCFLIGPGGAIVKAPEPKSASVEPAKPVESAPAKPVPAPAKEKPATTAMPATAPKPAPGTTAQEAAPAAKAAAPEAKKSEPKSDVPFRTMGLPGLPD